MEIKTEAIVDIKITPEEAFKLLCKSLGMGFVLDEDTDFFVQRDSYWSGENAVYTIENGHDEKYDDRGDLFVALRNVAVNMFPNVSFRNADYIYNN